MADQGRQLRPDEMPVYVIVNGKKLVAGRAPAFEKMYGKVKPTITNYDPTICRWEDIEIKESHTPEQRNALVKDIVAALDKKIADLKIPRGLRKKPEPVTFESPPMCEDERAYWGVPEELPEGVMCDEERDYWGVPNDTEMCDEEKEYWGITDDDLPFDHPDRTYVETPHYKRCMELNDIVANVLPELNKKYYYLRDQRCANEIRFSNLLTALELPDASSVRAELNKLLVDSGNVYSTEVQDYMDRLHYALQAAYNSEDADMHFNQVSVERSKAYTRRNYLHEQIFGEKFRE